MDPLATALLLLVSAPAQVLYSSTSGWTATGEVAVPDTRRHMQDHETQTNRKDRRHVRRRRLRWSSGTRQGHHESRELAWDSRVFDFIGGYRRVFSYGGPSQLRYKYFLVVVTLRN